MSRHLPSHPSLEHLRKQAKDRLPDLRARNREARLADAQHAIAGEYGFRNWPALKRQVESLAPTVAWPGSCPLAGTWVAQPADGQPAAGRPESATLRFDVDDDRVTITDVVVDAAGEVRRGENELRADGREYRSSHGYMIAAQWLDSRALEAVISKAGQPVSRVRYAVSTDGTTLTLSSTAAAHDGYPAVDDVRVFVRA